MSNETQNENIGTIVVGFGSHETNVHTLEWAARLAARSGSHLTVVNVFHPTYVEMSPTTHDELLDERRKLIEHTVATAGHDDVEIVVLEGEAADELLRYAHMVNADLIVIGHLESMAPGGFGQLGASESLLHHSDIPFVVVGPKAPFPAGDGETTMVVGVDGSKANAESVGAIARIARAAKATPVPVLSVNTGASTTRDHYGAHLIGEEQAAGIAKRLSADARLLTMNESPVQGLIEAAADLDAFCIAIGTRGHRNLLDLFAGQLTRHMIQNSDRAVLIAPHL